jgi:hypothetical protein
MLHWYSLGHGQIEEAFCWRVGGDTTPEAWDKFMHNTDIAIDDRGPDWSFDDIYVGGYGWENNYNPYKYYFGGLRWSIVNKPTATDEEIWGAHAKTPTCPHCGVIDPKGPLYTSEYRQIICDNCGKYYSVYIRDKEKGGGLAYMWKIDKPDEGKGHRCDP